MYFANSEGLIEYNGISHNTYFLPKKKTVRSVFVDNFGHIFTGLFEEFGYWSNDGTPNIHYHRLSGKIKMPRNDEIWKICTLKGKIYFQSFTSIYIYDYKTVKMVKAPYTMLFMFCAGEKLVVQILDKGLFWFDGRRFIFIQGSEIFAHTKVHAVIPCLNNAFLVCTANHGIYSYDGKRFSYFNSEVSDFLKYYTCNAGIRIPDGRYAFGTILNGVVVTDVHGKIVDHYNYSNGLNNNTVLSLFCDRQNGLWVGLDEGTNYISLSSPYTSYSNTTGTLGTIYAVLKDQNKIYLGTNHGLYVSQIGGNLHKFDFENVRFIPNSQGQVWSLAKFGNQILCGHNEGTFSVMGNSLRKISDITGGWTIKPLENLLMEGTYTGIVLFKKDKKGQWSFFRKINGYSEPTRHLETDYQGFIWTSHYQRGVYKLELNENLDKVVRSTYFASFPSASAPVDVFSVNNRIVFTTSNKIYTYDYIHNRISSFDELNQSLGEYRSSTQIIPFSRNYYWFVNNDKIALFKIKNDFKAKRIMVLFQKNSNLPGRDLAIIQLNDQTLLVPNRQAFSTYDLSLHEPVSPWGVFFQRLVFKGKNKTIECGLKAPEKIKIPYSCNNLTAFFACPSRFDDMEKKFYYRLKGLDDNWHETSLDNFTYLNLPHGTWTLELRPLKGNKTAVITFTVACPWYLSWFAIALYLILLMYLAYLGRAIFKAELNRHRKLIEYEVKKNKLENELDHKSSELMLTMRYLIQKNEILTELKNQILDIKSLNSRYPIKFVDNMDHIINQGLESQTEEWKTAMANLKLSEQGFFKKLKEKYPDLTNNDLRLCSYLRMNFSTKEIARLLNISTRGVEISRYRIRRKFQLSHDVNLTEFLMNEMADS
ncbi:MAG: two-component regulator propeller domain-containing protein [Bacteroidota bacterium]|nr:two-component regulator propeller domain-containing protein [Bacteroidota bacterium]